MRVLPIVLALLAPLVFAQEMEEKPQEDPYRLKPDHARTPFSAAEIRAACPAGRVTVLRMERLTGERFLQVFRFHKGDEEGTELETAMLSPDGKNQLSSQRGRTKWADLQAHASYPKDQTTRTEKRVKTPAGTFDCWQYLVVTKLQDKGVERTMERRFWFAKNLAGPPVKMTVHLDGKKTFDMLLVENRNGNEAALLKAMGFEGVAGATDEQKKKYAAVYEKLEKKEGSEADYVGERVHAAEAAAIFQRIDKDADGKLSLEEIVKGSGIVEPKHAGRAFAQLDHDANGSVSPEEFGKVTGNWSSWQPDK